MLPELSLRHLDIAAASLLVYLLYRALLGSGLKSSRYRLSSPPGPRSLPFIGNAHQIPGHFRWLTYMAWNRTFGDIVHAKYYSQDLVIISSPKIACDLLEKRSEIYSDRARLIMAGELVGFEKATSFSHYGSAFREKRKLLNKALSARASKDYWPLQIRETRAQCCRILDSPKDFVAHISRSAAAVVLQVSRGHTLTGMDDPHLTSAQDVLVIFEKVTRPPGKFLVDSLPWLRYVPSWLPGAGFKRQAAVFRKELLRLVREPVESVKRNMQLGIQPACYISRSIEYMGGLDKCSKETEENIMWSAVTLYGGGRDTIVSITKTFFLAMTKYPEVQKKAQAEVDRVTGGVRLPEFEDRDRMPYVNAIFKESLRWRPPSPLGVPHRLTQDDVYDGYVLKKGTSVIANIWAMCHDETVYPEPEVFRPERFLEEDGVTSISIPYAKDFGSNVFGFGRRICAGMHVADSALWIAIATSLAVLDILKEVDEDGVEIEPKVECIPGIVIDHKPWPCRIVPRSEAAAALVRQSVECA